LALNKGKRRLFLALWPDENVRRQLFAVLSRGGHLMSIDGSPVNHENLHMTLLFLGDVHAGEAINLITSLDNVVFAPFDMAIDRWGYFHKPGILWLGATENPDELNQLYKQIKRIVARYLNGVSNNQFKPHISLLRNAKSLPQVNDFEAIDWHVNSFVLVESKLRPDGVEYTVLQEWHSEI